MTKKDNSGSWETYIAMYKDETPGSTTVRMELIDISPIKKYPIMVETGLAYSPNKQDGFPEDQTMEVLHEFSSKLENLFLNLGDHLFVGSFMSNGNRLEYYYLPETNDIESKLKTFYKNNYPNNKHEINVIKDPKWTYYRDFLYPNNETLNYMEDEKLIKCFEESGDNITKPRKIIYWLKFKSERKMTKCKDYLLQEGFLFESVVFNKTSELPFELQIWNESSLIIDSIYPTTSFLKITSAKYKGRYDGWETSTVIDKET